ncbi:MAG: TetR/AcrR family transcriptional regulator [Candidatus Heritagella sp.]
MAVHEKFKEDFPVPRENQRVRLSKHLLQEALLSLLEKKSLEKITVSELCRTAGINRATFYRHYAIPRDVLLDVDREIWENMHEKMKTPETPEDIHSLLEEICEYWYRNRRLIEKLIATNTDYELAQLLKEWNEKMRGEKIPHPKMEGMREEDRNLLSTFLGYGGYFMLRQWIMEKIPKTPGEMADFIYRLIV